MEDRARDVSFPVSEQSVSQQSVSQQSISQQSISQSALTRQREGRGAWVLTAYGISGLAVFAILAYFFSDFIAR